MEITKFHHQLTVVVDTVHQGCPRPHPCYMTCQCRPPGFDHIYLHVARNNLIFLKLVHPLKLDGNNMYHML
jgi:hypothetical protein